MSDLRKHLNENFKHRMAIINGEEYVSMDVFQEAIAELALADAALGCITLKLGAFKITDKELTEFMSKKCDSVETTYKDGEYILKRL